MDSEVARLDSVKFQGSTASLPVKEENQDEDIDEQLDREIALLRKPKSEQLLDPKCRPHWLSKEGMRINFFNNISEITLDGLVELGRKAEDLDYKYDISNFINKPPPSMKRPLTVGGLDKKQADLYWKMLKNPKGEPESAKNTRSSFWNRPISGSGSFDAGKLDARSGSFNAHGVVSRKSFIDTTNSIDEHVQMTIERLRLHADKFSPPKSPTSAGKRNTSVTHMSSAALSAASWELYDSNREEKKLSLLAKKNPPDYQVSNLLDVDFSHRKINLGEKEMLQRGIKLESQGDIKAAISCYTNAGAHSKDQQISRMLLGNLHYRTGHLMTALKFYSVAIQIIEMKPEALRLPHDQFLAYYNRAIINFRLGSDEAGIEDMEKAEKVNPNDISTHEIMSLAKRRVGKYSEAIDEAIISETHRQEKKKKDLMQAIEAAKLLQKKELGDVPAETKAEETLPSLPRASMSRGRESMRRTMLLRKQSTTNSIMNALTGPNRISVRRTSRDSSQSSRQPQEGANHITSTTAAIALRRDEYFKGLSPTKGLVLEVPNPYTNSGLRDRINESKRGLKDGNGMDELNTEGGFLKAFKIKAGTKLELFDELFLKPNPLQDALLTEPNKRTLQHLELISDTVKQFPFANKLSFSTLQEVATVIEYRALNFKEELFQQNIESGAVIFLLKGDIQVKMDGSVHTGMLDVPMGNLKDFSLFGHIDLLFRHPRPVLRKAIEDSLTEYVEHSYLWDNSPMTLAAAAAAASTSVNGANSTSNLGTQSAVSQGNNQPPPLLPAATSHSMDPKLLATQTPHNNVVAFDSIPNIEDTNTTVNGSAMNERKIDNETYHKHIQDFMNYWNRTEDLSKLPRSVSPGMFMTYQMQSPCELLMMSEKDFQRVLYEAAVQEFSRRLKGIIASGIFKGWKPEELIRLARMGQVLTINNGETIIKQGAKPQYLYIILKGMCKVMKKPNRTEMLLQNLKVSEERADRHDLKYVFHHKVARGGLDSYQDRSPSPPTGSRLSPLNSPSASHSELFSPSGNPTPVADFAGGIPISPLKDGIRSQLANSPNINVRKSTKKSKRLKNAFADVKSMNEFSTSVIMDATKPTEAEKVRMETEQEIIKYKTLIHKARVLDAMEKRNAYQRRMTRLQSTSHQSAVKTHLGLTQDNRTEDAKILDLAYTLGKQNAEIKILQWPMIFGESCVLDPENGVSRGSIIADTLCEVFVVNSIQLQTFPVDDGFIDRVKGKAVVYPADSDLVVNLYRQQEWKEYRKEVLKTVATESSLRKSSALHPKSPKKQ